MAAMLAVRRSRTVNPMERGSRKMQLKRKLAILALPAVLAIAGGAIAVNAATTPSPTPKSSQKETANEPAEAHQVGEGETAHDAGEIGTAGQTGHNDVGEVDHQATGTE